jgi:ribosomal protein L14E/L6E/L27E
MSHFGFITRFATKDIEEQTDPVETIFNDSEDVQEEPVRRKNRKKRSTKKSKSNNEVAEEEKIPNYYLEQVVGLALRKPNKKKKLTAEKIKEQTKDALLMFLDKFYEPAHNDDNL